MIRQKKFVTFLRHCFPDQNVDNVTICSRWLIFWFEILMNFFSQTENIQTSWALVIIESLFHQQFSRKEVETGSISCAVLEICKL